MNTEIIELLKSLLGNFQIEYTDVNGTPAIYINEKDILEVCNILKNNDSLKYNSLVDAVSVDRF